MMGLIDDDQFHEYIVKEMQSYIKNKITAQIKQKLAVAMKKSSMKSNMALDSLVG